MLDSNSLRYIFAVIASSQPWLGLRTGRNASTLRTQYICTTAPLRNSRSTPLCPSWLVCNSDMEDGKVVGSMLNAQSRVKQLKGSFLLYAIGPMIERRSLVCGRLHFVEYMVYCGTCSQRGFVIERLIGTTRLTPCSPLYIHLAKPRSAALYSVQCTAVQKE